MEREFGPPRPRKEAKEGSSLRVFGLSLGSWPRSLLLATALLLALSPALVMAAPSTPHVAQVQPEVWEALEAGGEAEVLVLLQQQADLRGATALQNREPKGRYVYEELRATAEGSQRSLRAMLEARGAEYQSFYIVNALKVRADSRLVQALAARPEVKQILSNPRVRGVPDLPLQSLSSRAPQGVQENLVRVNADDVWAIGYTGQGIVVAGQDTGYDWKHPALIGKYREPQPGYGRHDFNWHDAIHANDPHTAAGNPCGFDSAEPCDDHASSHGTHTMGIMVGDDGAGNQIGMAPGARWIGCRNMEEGWGTPATYLECFEFFLAPYPVGGAFATDGVPELAPHVVNNSWACPPREGCDSATLEAAVAALRQAGIVVVASAGNYGSSCGSVIYPPAIYQQLLSIGNWDHQKNQISSLSSRGPVTYGGTTYTKPDLAAPGVNIYSSIRSSLPGSDYGLRSGTSMAAPHVAGAVALLLSAAPGLAGEVSAIEQILTRTAEPRTTTQGCGGDGPDDVPNNVWGWGIVDALAAVESGLVQGLAADASDGRPIPGGRVAVDGMVGAEAVTDGSGHYALALASGTYSLTAQARGYFSQTVSHVVVITGQITLQDFALAPWPRFYLPLVIREP